MEFQEFIKLIRKKGQTIFTIMLVLVVLVLTASLLSPLKYGVKSRLLVVQNTSNTDAYSLSRSNEYLGNLFAEVAYSSSFYDQVRASKYNVDRNYFTGDYSQQIKKWRKTVQTRTQGDTGIIEVNIYHPQVSEARKISLAVNDILINKNQDYQGGQNVKISIIDQPLASNYPVKPNLPVNGFTALFGSFVFALIYIYVFPEEKYDIYLFGKKTSSSKKFIVNKGAGRPVDKLSFDLLERMEREEMVRREAEAEKILAEKTENKIETQKNEKLSGNIRNILSR